MAEDNAASKPRRRWLLPAVLLVLAVIGAGGFFAWQMLSPKTPAAKPPAPPVFMALEPFTVNLQPGGAQRHLHVALSLRLQDAATQALLAQYLPEVRSRVLAVLANREGQALMEPPARQALSEELLQALRRPYSEPQPPGQVLAVMFTTFLLQ